MYPKTKQLVLTKLEQGYYPGVVGAFINQDRVESFSAGNAQITPEIQPMETDLLFDVASLTKVIATTSLVLRLWEDGKIDLDAPLHAYLPAFENRMITLRHLLTHTSNIETWIPDRDQLTQEQLISAYLKLQPGKQLGHVVKYTDTGTILLAFMLEEIFQEPATELFQEQVLAPLGMMNSTFLPYPSKKIVPTEQLSSGEVLRGITHDPKARVLAEHAGNAGLFIDLEDSIKFVKMYLDLGKAENGRFLEAKTIQALFQDQTPDKNGYRSLGWDLKKGYEKQQPILFHTGYTGTFLLIDVSEQEAFIFLSNRVHPTDKREAYIQCRYEIVEIYLKEKASLKK
ncbi:MAG: beta-lactamase family protein [Enterococcus lacertideformus]|uniref:Beta-lactamase family protein n=1 Tax=Enterococcus lacertideformus TaxID=2771493 RepID=A0A931FC76_9ENTE|nr:beta-lactamase family protein [Enterococcus lacertideformus]